ncbi:MAG: hypothetical protein WEC75_11540 [Dehalococcoidia bacterium]
MGDDLTGQVNRFAIIVVALVVAFGALVVVLVAWGEASASIGQIEDFAGFLRDHDDDQGKLIVTLGALVVVLLMATVIVIEITPTPVQVMRLRNVTADAGTITTKEIADRIDAEALQVPHVAACKSIVAARGGRVEVVLDLHVDAGADLAAAADETCRRTHELVERKIGVELVQPPQARMHYRELRLRQERPLPEEMRLSGLTESSGWERPPQGEGQRDDG